MTAEIHLLVDADPDQGDDIEALPAEPPGQADSGASEPQRSGQIRMLLNELSPRGVGVYCNRPFVAGQVISLELAVPNRIFIRGRVTYCMEQDAKMTVISENPFYYRIGIRFMYLNAVEEAAVRKYCEDIASALLGAAG